MNNDEIINMIISDKRYKSICKSIAKKPYLADDLYQEFALKLCEITDERMVEANDGKYLEVFCIGMLHNIWSRKERVSSVFFEYSNNIEIEKENVFVSDDGYNFKYDLVEKEVKKVIEEEMQSSDTKTMYKSRVFYYSYFQYKDPAKFSKSSGIPYSAVIKVCADYKNKLKRIFKPQLHD